jgi:hypothetical protein
VTSCALDTSGATATKTIIATGSDPLNRASARWPKSARPQPGPHRTARGLVVSPSGYGDGGYSLCTPSVGDDDIADDQALAILAGEN